MASIRECTYKDGRPFFRVEVRLKGFPPQRASFRRKTDARRYAVHTEAAIREGRYFKTNESRKHTLSDAIKRYRESLVQSKEALRHKSAQLRWWDKELGYYTMADITPALLSERRDKLMKKRAPATVIRYLAVMSHLLSTAVKEWGWIEHNPMLKVARPKEPRGRVRFLSDEERELILQACKESECKPLYLIVVLALSTGMRQGEIMNLRWPDIDLERNRIVLHITKNGERRVVPLAGHALGEVQEHSKVRRIDTDLLFPGRKHNRPFFVREPWMKAVKKAGIEDFRFHDLRHSAASYMLMSGASLGEIAELLGHKTLQMVQRYSHMSEPHSAKIVAKMNQEIFG